MKTAMQITATLVLACLSLTSFGADKTVESTAPGATSEKGSHVQFTTQVLKVFSAKDGDGVFRAYLVQWKGQEVIAGDPLLNSNYQVGDSIAVLAMNIPLPHGKPEHRLLQFHVLPKDMM